MTAYPGSAYVTIGLGADTSWMSRPAALAADLPEKIGSVLPTDSATALSAGAACLIRGKFVGRPFLVRCAAAFAGNCSLLILSDNREASFACCHLFSPLG